MIEIHHGDARKILPELVTGLPPEQVIVLTDPPWPACKADIDGKGDEAVPLWKATARLVPQHASRLVLWLSEQTDPRGFVDVVPPELPFLRLAWLRLMPPMNLGRILHGADVAYIFGPTIVPAGFQLLPGEAVAKNTMEMRARRKLAHPCPRSLEHARWLLRWYGAGAKLVIDPFCGSGTTLVAAAELGMDGIGIESRAAFADEARERVRQTPAPLPGLPTGIAIAQNLEIFGEDGGT